MINEFRAHELYMWWGYFTVNLEFRQTLRNYNAVLQFTIYDQRFVER
jgi:hypothetical protein